MGKIKVLGEEISNKIAAGEVVDRPASVVKELVENSIDAGSSAITVEIKGGGITFIRVTDNGSGMEDDDVVVAFERHATSKISHANDLFNISTLGFRGEALASISAVSQVELITKTQKCITGKIVEINGGKVIKNEEIGCPNGTTIIIRNLFYNTPARLKFLKKESTESGIISDLMERLSLTHPEISFKLINNNNTVIHTPGNGNVLDTILSVFGKDFAKAMIPVNSENNGVKIKGFIGRPEISRSNRNYQCIFINERFIRNKIISSAIDNAYKTMITVNKYPTAILYFTMEPSMVDVNVHPSKMEVRFNNEELISNLVLDVVSGALKNNILIPQIVLDVKHVEKEDLEKTSQSIEKMQEVFPQRVNETKEEYVTVTSKEPKIAHVPIIKDKPAQEMIPIKETIQEEVKINKNYRIIGQIFSTYIIVEMDEKMFVIDQHAAHERVKFNNLTEKFNNNEGLSQGVVSPIIVELTFNESKKVEENLQLFRDLGYEIEPFGDTTYMLRSVPYVLGENYAKEFFIEVVDALFKKKISNVLDLREEMLHSMACKSAIKANKVLTGIEVDKLVKDVLSMKDAFTCPHGRPIIIAISKYELEKMFKRVM